LPPWGAVEVDILGMLKSFNKVARILIYYDLVLFFGWGFVAPILAIFITQQIKGGDVQVAGIAIGFYWVLKSILQIPIGHYLDKRQGEKDDFYALVAGTFLASLVPIGFIFAHAPWHIYLLQIFHAIGMGLALPAWCGIFTRHIDKGKEAQTWAWDSSALGIGEGVAGIIGGIVAKIFGFFILFVGVSIFGLISTALTFLIKKDLFEKDKQKEAGILIAKPE
jgi:MFS transporter, DHA1 family, multidrug resistance protein